MLDVDAAAQELLKGGIVAFPTETVYGLAASASDAEAQYRIYEIKGRPRSMPLILMVAEPDELDGWVEVDDRARRFMIRFWPGPLTLVLKRPGEPPTLGVRVPDHPLALRLLRIAGPLMTTSANLSGESPALTAEEAARLPGLSGAVDGGRVTGGVPSTVLDLSGAEPTVLREGALTAHALGLTRA